MEGLGALGVVFNGDQFPGFLSAEKIFYGGVVNNFEILVGAHGAATIIFFLADNMNFTHVKRVGGTDNGTDIEIVFDVFNGDFEASTLLGERRKNLFVGEAFVFIDEVAGVFHGGIITYWGEVP